MSLWSRLANVFRSARLTGEIDEELQSHLEEALAEGRDPVEARRSLGPALAHRETSRDIRLIPWIESLYADAVFGWRQLLKRKVTSAAAILSLALAIGSCAAAFRLMDAMLWRPLPVAAPERLYALTRAYTGPDGKVTTGDLCAYPMFRAMRALVKDGAELIAIAIAQPIDLTYGSDDQTEKASQQFVSGWMFQSFGIQPAAGRLFTEADDRTPGAHPYAVLSYDYWKRRFAEDPAVVGKTFRTGNEIYQIVGVAQGPFTGTEPGSMTDIFMPTMMMRNNAIVRSDYQWFRTFVHLRPGVSPSLLLEKIRPAFADFLAERAKGLSGLPRREVQGFLRQKLLMNPASAGVSGMRRWYATGLFVLGGLVMLVLFIACANVANLMTAQAAAREREMALRISIGAGRWRLIQLVVVECGWLAFFAAAIGACFAAWAAPMVVGMIGTPENPFHLVLPADWRVLRFGALMALGCTILFGLAPALRASGVNPLGALKGGSPHRRPRLMQTLIAAQVAFCVLVLFVAGLFVSTSARLARQPLGFSAERLLTLETVTPQPQSEPLWTQTAARLRTLPGVESVSICEWPLMAGGSWSGLISVHGAPPSPVASYFLTVSPEWRGQMNIPLLAGRDFRVADPASGAALVNQSFARQYFAGDNPVGKSFDVVSVEGRRIPYEIVGVVGDARYRDMRESMQPTTYFPFKARYERATFMVRTASPNPLSMGSVLRAEVARAGGGLRVSTLRTETALIDQNTTRERLLSTLALFFGIVALLLAAVGLYGVLDYSVLQRRREIGIRIAVGAQAQHVARNVLTGVLLTVLVGTSIGLLLGEAAARFIASLLFEIKPTDPSALAIPALIVSTIALLAAIPALRRAIRIDPIATLRAE